MFVDDDLSHLNFYVGTSTQIVPAQPSQKSDHLKFRMAVRL